MSFAIPLAIIIVLTALGNLAWAEDKLTVTDHRAWKAVWGFYWLVSGVWLFFALLMFLASFGVRT